MLYAELSTLQHKHEQLLVRFVGRQYSNLKAHEHATQGFARRVKILRRSVENVFRLLPPERTDVPSQDEISDATINIHAFLLSVFGSLDNLAWMWVYERGVTGNKGKQLPLSQVGLGAKCLLVRASFSKEFNEYLSTMDRWFVGMEKFRHALAHRIPLYIPPFAVDQSKAEQFRRFDELKADALRRLDLAEHERLAAEQMTLVTFRPTYIHSFQEDSPEVRFHGQLLADFNTVHALGLRIIGELDR